MEPDGHRTAERRSIALHAAVAARLDASVLARASQRVASWLEAGGPVPRDAATAWSALLAGPPAELREALVRDDETMRALRQNTPFAGVVPAAERWRIVREVR